MSTGEIIFIIFIILVIIILLALLLWYLMGHRMEAKSNAVTYPGGPYYSKEEYKAKLPSELDLDNLPSGNELNNKLRYIGISEREAIPITYKNLKEKTILENTAVDGIYRYIGTKFTTTNNNVILFLDDIILDRKDIDFTFGSTTVGANEYKILKQLLDVYNKTPKLQIGPNVNRLYVYTRGFSCGLGYLIYFGSQNTGSKEFLIEGYPSIVQDPHRILETILSPSNRSIFYNTLQDPLINMVKTTEFQNGQALRFDSVPYSTVFSYTGLDTISFKIHEIMNYLEPEI